MDDAAKKLTEYLIPNEVLPFAPTRQLFSIYNEEILKVAAELVCRYPEKRGTLSHAVRALGYGESHSCNAATVTIEGHILGRDVSDGIRDELIKLGFEPDGFAKYNPPHFNTHLTLKFAIPAKDLGRRKEIYALVKERCESAFVCLNKDGYIEAYVECEIYKSSNRRRFNKKILLMRRAKAFPLKEKSLKVVCPAYETTSTGNDCWKKMIDIHVKLASNGMSQEVRTELITRLCETGFYHVVTWAGNDICTAEFLHTRDANRVYTVMENYFSRYGGASEMTLECVTEMWRTRFRCNEGLAYASVSPLVVGLRF